MTKEQSPNSNTKPSSSEIADTILEGFKKASHEEDLVLKEKLQEWLNS